MSRKSREIGKRGERQWRDEVRSAGYECTRTAQHRGSPESPDVLVKGFPIPVHFEVKIGQSPPIRSAMVQAERDCGDDMPVVASKRHRESWLVTLRRDDFFHLIQHYAPPGE